MQKEGLVSHAGTKGSGINTEVGPGNETSGSEAGSGNGCLVQSFPPLRSALSVTLGIEEKHAHHPKEGKEDSKQMRATARHRVSSKK